MCAIVSPYNELSVNDMAAYLFAELSQLKIDPAVASYSGIQS